ncbi:MAG: ATP-binding protein [Alphaproteobacteria bacterium]|nr:ATP-binding protein [Alphaproteobacteria bacterium]
MANRPSQGRSRILKQAFLNLLYNSADFTPSGGLIGVKVGRAASGELVISFSNTGIGIAPEDIQKEMMPFGQVESKMSRLHAGTGLGLPLSETFIKLHGGRLEIASEINKGTTAPLYLPSERLGNGFLRHQN